MAPELPESMKLPAIAIMSGLRQLFPTVPEDRFREVVTTELANAVVGVATMKEAPEDFKALAVEVAERVKKKLREELS
jgi:hypothetical protein